MTMPQWQAYLQTHRDRFLADLLEFLRIPSISSLSQNRRDVVRAARWLARRMKAAGLEQVAVLPAGRHPVVCGEWLHAPGRPTLLVYGHFDVEPAGPAERWTTPPFQPALRNGRVYARGASDDKGNLLIPVQVAEAWLRTTGALPVNLKFLFEGQEEIGSPDLPAFVAAHRNRLACDLVVSADGGQVSETQPALTLSCRGLCALEVLVQGPATDLHSGVYGGAIQNPIHALAHLLASLRQPDGRIAVAGFYDGVSAVPVTTSFDEEAYKALLGVTELFGEPGHTTWERSWTRPTIEVNGIGGGCGDSGVQAVLPAEAFAKLTCRLVEGQDPARVLDLLEEHVQRHVLPGARVTVTRLPGVADAYRMPADHWANGSARAVLHQVYGLDPLEVGMGATIPVCPLFLERLGVHTLLFGFGLDDENIHAPDEFLRLASWDRGQLAYGLLFQHMAKDSAG